MGDLHLLLRVVSMNDTTGLGEIVPQIGDSNCATSSATNDTGFETAPVVRQTQFTEP